MITRDKMAEMLDQMAASVRQMPRDAEIFRASYSDFDGADLFLGCETLNTMIFGHGNYIYTVTPCEDYDMIEVSIRIGSIKLFALYDAEEFKKFMEMEKTPDAATSGVEEEEFAERLQDLRNLLSLDILTPADDEVKEEES